MHAELCTRAWGSFSNAMLSREPRSHWTSNIRWWPGMVVMVTAALLVLFVRLQTDWPFQRRNLSTVVIGVVAAALLWLWWLLLSRAPWKSRLLACGGAAVVLVAGAALFRIGGVSGDLLPILEPRWRGRTSSDARGPGPAAGGHGVGSKPAPVTATQSGSAPTWPDYPQFLGPERNGKVTQVRLDADWSARPPQVLWRRPIGAAWSGFAIVGDRAFTQEQRGDEELVSCYDAASGELIWSSSDHARYHTTIAGEGPRCTPTVVGGRVFTLGATGLLNCLEAADGRRVWQRDLCRDAVTGVPEWGFAGSPLVLEDRVIVSAGGRDDRSLIAYSAGTGDVVWTGGSAPAGYSSPAHAVLAGVPQILVFNARRITAHAAASGKVLWEHPWGVGHPHVSVPVLTGSNRVVFSSGYGVGAELLELSPGSPGWTVTRVWKSSRLKSKFANLIAHGEYVYGLDDGVLACVALADGSRRWREGRYGHGQMIFVEPLLLLMAENGELVLLQPTPDAPNERQRFEVFKDKTWNPPALSGDRLLVRNDREAVALRLALAP